MESIYLDAKDIPNCLRSIGGYSGRKFKVIVQETVTLGGSSTIWQGGSKTTQYVVNLETGKHIRPNLDATPKQGDPFGWIPNEGELKLQRNLAVVEHDIFCGSDMGLTFIIHPDNAPKFIPAKIDLSDREIVILVATSSLKSSYNGMDRFEHIQRFGMGLCNSKYRYLDSSMSRLIWNQVKAGLIEKGLLNKAGAITPKGRNAV